MGGAAPELAAIQSADDLQALAGAIVAELEAQGAEPGQVTVTAADHSPVIVRRSNMDDSLTHTVFTVFAVPITDGGLVVIATRAVDICGRGTTTLDGETVCVEPGLPDRAAGRPRWLPHRCRAPGPRPRYG